MNYEKYIRNEIEYTRKGDYYISNIVVPAQTRTGKVGKYGKMNNIKVRAEKIVTRRLFMKKSSLYDMESVEL